MEDFFDQDDKNEGGCTPSLAAIRETVSKIVTKTRQSTVMSDKLRQIQTEILGQKTPKKLIQEVATRWNSCYEMLERFLEVKPAVSLLLSEPGMDSFGPFTSEKWKIIEAAVALLHPCYQATVELSSEKFATASKVIPITKMLLLFYAKEERTQDGFRKELAANMRLHLGKRYEKVEDTTIYSISTLLDPRFKNHAFRQNEKKDRAIAKLKQELLALSEKKKEESTAASSTTTAQDLPTAPKTMKTDLWSSFDTDVSQLVSTKHGSSSLIEMDVRNYFSLSCEPRSCDPLTWWVKEGKQRFPLMYELAVKYLSVPATSVPSERVFSSAGDIISANRSRLGEEKARMLICLHSNLK